MQLAALLAAVFFGSAADQDSLASQMSRLGVRDAVVLPSSAVDEQPVWSPDGKYLAANVYEKWIRIEIDRLALELADWRGKQPVGIARARGGDSPIEEAIVRSWERGARFDPRKVVTRSGTRIELRHEDLGTQFIVTRKGSKPETRWTTALENCHSLALSPDDRYVAFVCEENGVVVATP
jgi:Tol biopolymer transport system component